MNPNEPDQPLGLVYVVDDDEAVRDSLQFLLEPTYRVAAFDSAEAFLGRYDAKAIACLILDVRMPGMSDSSCRRTPGARLALRWCSSPAMVTCRWPWQR